MWTALWRSAGVLLLLAPALVGCSSPGSEQEPLGSLSEAKCLSLKLSQSPLGVIGAAPGATLTTVGATCAIGETAEYRFTHKREGTTVETELQPYGPSPSVAVSSNALPSGKYTFKVYSRAIGSTKAQSSSSLTAYVGDVCTSVTLATSPKAPQAAGTPVLLTGNAACSGGSPEYRFLARAPGATAYTLVRDWDDEASTAVDTAAYTSGSAAFQVQARAQGNLSTYESYKALSYRFAEPCTGLTTSVSAPSPQPQTAPITVSASASCGNANPVYRFLFSGNGLPTTVFRDWSEQSSASWNLPALAAGTYKVKVEVRGSDYAGAALMSKIFSYSVGSTCSGVTLSLSPKLQAPLGTPVGLTAGGSCSGSLPEFQFLARAPGASSYVELREFDLSNTATFPTTSAAAGSWAFQVVVRPSAGDGITPYKNKALSYKLTGGCTGGGCCTTAADCPTPESACQQASCVNGMCGVANLVDGSGCEDDDLCTATDTCQSGACVGSDPVTCPATDSCHDVGECDSATGVCSDPVLVDGSECTSSGQSGVCSAGACHPDIEVVDTSPADGGSIVGGTALGVTFNVPVVGITTQSTAGTCSGTLQVSLDDFATCIGLDTPTFPSPEVVSVAPRPGLLVNRSYKLRVTTEVTNELGVNLASQYTQASGFVVNSPDACSGSVVISKIYGGGGSVNNVYNRDFVELHNRGTTAVSLQGWSLQYSSATGTGSWVVGSLAGTILPGRFFLVGLGPPSQTGINFPSDNSAFNVQLAATGGKVALVNNTTALNGACATGTNVVDFVGYGAANCAIGTPTAATTVFTGVARATCLASFDNASDFAVGSLQEPRTSLAPPIVCGCAVVNESNLVAEADYCNLQFPQSFSATAGASSPVVYGRVFEVAVTEAAGPSGMVAAQLGYGPLNSNPQYEAGWSFVRASHNVQVGNDDEYQASFTMPPPGDYAYAYRVSLDRGITWTYCDGLSGSGSNSGLSFDLVGLGTLTSTP